MTKYLLIFLLVGCATAPCVYAFNFSDQDLSVKTGVITGTLTNSSQVGGFNYGGFPLVIGYNLDLGRDLTVCAEFGLVLDTQNFQVTRSGLELVGSYHILGSSRRLSKTFSNGNIEMVGRSPYDASLGVRAGFQKYSATAGTGADQVSANGQVFEIMVGAQFRQEISESSALTIEFYTTAASLAASLDQLKSQHMLTLLSWRFLL